MKEEIFVYRRDGSGTIHLIETYENARAFGNAYLDKVVEAEFRNSDSERVRGTYNKWDINTKYPNWTWSVFAKVAYNSKGKLLTVDLLVGYARSNRGLSRLSEYDKIWMKKMQGRKRRAYGTWRHPRTLQEKRWAHAWDDEEFCPPVRAVRQGYHLPDVYDDYYSHNEKNWKRHRKTQWRRAGD